MAERLLVVLYPDVADWEVTFPLFCLRPGIKDTFASTGQGKVVAGICGAPLVLGAAGLLKGRRFACDITEDTRGWFDGATRVDEAICVDGKVLTAGVSAILPFTIELARLLGSEKTADEIDAFFVR